MKRIPCRNSFLTEGLDQSGHISRQRGLKHEFPPVIGVPEPQSMGVQRLTAERNRSQVVGTVSVALLPDQGVAAEPGLQTNLVAAAAFKPDFEQRGLRELLEDTITADGFLRPRIAPIGFLLNECLVVPGEMIAPRASWRVGLPINDREIHPFGLTAPELVLEACLRLRLHRKEHQAGRVTIDAMDDKRLPLPFGSQVEHELVLHRVCVLLARQRHGQQTSRLVDDDNGLILVNDGQFAGARRPVCGLAGATRPVHPHAHLIAAGQTVRRVLQRDLTAVEKHLAAFERRAGAAARPEPGRIGKKLVEPQPDSGAVHRPLIVGHRLDPMLPGWVMSRCIAVGDDGRMENTNSHSSPSLTAISDGFADVVARIAPSVVQVLGRRRPASGIAYAPQVVVASARALGRSDGLRVRGANGDVHDALLAGWDPATGLAVLRAPGLDAPAAPALERPVRVGHLATAIARSWSNAVTASVCTVAIIGGPLATGRRLSIEEIIRTTATMHDGFAGGAFADSDGRLAGVCTAAEIRGLGVVIPARIVAATVASILEHGSARRGYLGLAGQTVSLPEAQKQDDARNQALLVVSVTAGSPAAQAGMLVGDLLLDFDGQPVRSSEDLLDLLHGDLVGRSVTVRLLRGTVAQSITMLVGERPVG